ncbi:hypothetical protein GE09DRAFT_13060 [Coniochaeta sp. 2T2.1]|nr:hypothetical protein GE09DRAFT_13060 [Coniochaeta sp. 2T2.1]
MAALNFRRSCRGGCSRPSLGKLVLMGAVSACISFLLIFAALPDSKWEHTPIGLLDDIWPETKRMPVATPLMPLLRRVACTGPRGLLLSRSPDDELRSETLDIPYPTPFVGSYSELGIDQSWMTADGRYGPYGYGDEDATVHNRTRVDWDMVDWANIQNECFDRNANRFPQSATRMTNEQRFRLRNQSTVPELRSWEDFTPTRRTAVVVRSYDGYRYTPEDMYNLRSLVVEAGLRTGGEYTVMLLVDIRGADTNIFASKGAYREAFERAQIPPEFQSIALLWDEALLRSWYPDIGEYRTEFQVFQPMQLLALHHPEFDHYWQLEMDMRFLGDAGQYLDRLSAFARAEPRKQALERSTFQYMPSKFPSYAAFTSAVDSAARQSSHVWGPLRIRDIAPIGPVPPVRSSKSDDFAWGVGEDADVVTTSFCTDVLAPTTAWVYKGWRGGFGSDVPRFFCPPAIMRASRTLLLAIHEAQLVHAMRVPSEATLPSFALWHGLKLSYPPHPLFMKQQGTEEGEERISAWYRGGPANSTDGIGPQDKRHPPGDGLTWWWESRWPREVLDSWFGKEEGELPFLLVRRGDQVFAPNVAMHPAKTQ